MKLLSVYSRLEQVSKYMQDSKSQVLTVGEGSYKYRKGEINITKGDKIHHVPPNMKIHHHIFGSSAKVS